MAAAARFAPVAPLHNHFDVRAMTGRVRERRVACDYRRINRLRQRDVHGIVRRQVLAQLPGSNQQIEMSVTVKVEVGQILDRLGRTVRRHFAHSNEASEALGDFNVHQVRRMQLVLISEKPGLDPGAKRCLQEKFQKRRRVEDDHADSRSSRMTTAAGVFNLTCFRL